MDLYNNSLRLDIFCADILEHFKEQGKNREEIGFWLHEKLIPTMENVIEEIFEDENEDE